MDSTRRGWPDPGADTVCSHTNEAHGDSPPLEWSRLLPVVLKAREVGLCSQGMECSGDLGGHTLSVFSITPLLLALEHASDGSLCVCVCVTV